MLPLSFKEYISAFDNNNYQQLFLDYMRNGGMPGSINILKSNPNDIDKLFAELDEECKKYQET